MLQSVFDQGSEKVKALLRDHVLPVLDAIERDITRGYDLAGMRALLPATDDIDGTIEPRDWVDGNVSFGTIHADFSLTALGRSQTVVHYGRGVRETDPGSSDVPYETFVTVNHSRTYRMGYSLTGASYPSNSTSSKDVVVILDLLVPMAGTYALDGCDYEGTMTAWDRISNTGACMAERAIETIANGSTGMLGGSLSSLSELPPLITDLVKGKDLDLSTAASVLSNLTMDISSSLREAAKELISSLVDGAISWSLDKLMELLDVEVLHAELRTGPLKLDLTSDTKALDGEDGRILVLIADVPTLGMHGSFGITRNGTKVLFNGTVEIEKGPLYLRLEIDPFMEVRDSIISIGGTYHGPEEDLRISVKAPEKVEYRSAEITLESILGMEPNVFIAPIGTSVFFNAGFRMRYQTPDELSPRINEIEFTDANLSRLEIFNPGKYQLSGCTLDLAPPNGPAYGIHSLDLITRGRYALLSVNHTTVKMWERSVDPARPLIVLVRDPSGMVMDRITVKGPWVGWYSRDADGYGVFRWGNGTPGWSNGGMASFSFSGLLIQLVRSSLEEAWTEVVGEYGLSFDSIARFVQEAMDHFVERVCSAVAELIVDVRMFISMKIAAGTGASAGFGAELAFIAEGEAVAEFIGWLYENIKVLIAKMFDPQGAGDFRTFPMTILEKCHIEAMVYSEVDTPKALSKLASKGKEFPTTLTLAVAGRVNMALPFRLMGKDIGAWKVSAGIFIMDAPRELVTLLYDVGSAETTIELWLLHISVWSEPRLSQLSG